MDMLYEVEECFTLSFPENKSFDNEATHHCQVLTGKYKNVLTKDHAMEDRLDRLLGCAIYEVPGSGRCHTHPSPGALSKLR
jgi:hypothetical protein